MATKQTLTVFGATGNQGSSVIHTVLNHPDISAKYHLRGVTRDKNSAKSKALTAKGVEMVEADLNDPVSIEAALKDSYSAYINTDYWTLLDKEAEIKQGKNIFDACQKAAVHHVVLSTLPHIERLSGGKYPNVHHFDSKAVVAEYAQTHKGDMVVSYFLPAMYLENIHQVSQERDGTTYISLPYADPDFAWPMITPSRDTGNYVVGLLEAGNRADGIAVQGVSAWTTPNKVARALETHLGKPVRFNSLDAKTYEAYLPEQIRQELSEMMQWIGESSYYGKGSEKNQPDSDKWLVNPNGLTSVEDFVKMEF